MPKPPTQITRYPNRRFYARNESKYVSLPGIEELVRAGETVEAGTVLVVLEAMKMEHSLSAPWAGTVSEVAVKPGDRVEEGVELVVLTPVDAGSLRQVADTE